MYLKKALIFACLFMTCFSVTCYSKKQPVNNTVTGFAVVELFTSEGCSSCPAAEAVLSQIHDEYTQNVYAMEFHVDYWNYLGWKDIFSSKTYTERQQQYARILHLSSTYTPQAIVNGKNELVGSDRSKIHLLINYQLQKKQANSIKLNATMSGNNVSVSYSITSTGAQMLNIALVQKKAETNVRKGENSGRKLTHVNVVRDFKTCDAKAQGTVNISFPQGLSASDCTVIAYTQNKYSWEVTGAAEGMIN